MLVMNEIRKSRFDPSAAMENHEWWKNKKCTSYLDIVCRDCGYASKCNTIDKFMRRKSAGCWCNNQVKWATPEGLKRLQTLVESSRFELVHPFDERSFVESGSCNTHLPLRCKVCAFVPSRCLLRHFKDTRTAECFCNGQASWASEQGRLRLLSICKESGVAPGELLKSSTWYSANVSGKASVVPLYCGACGTLTTNTTIDNFVCRGNPGCHCYHKTEALVAQFAESLAVGMEFKRNVDLNIGLSPLGGRMPYDIVGYVAGQPRVIIEVDGRQHFELLPSWNNSNTIKNDLIKERNATSSGIPMIRLHQPSVWGDKLEWKPFVAYSLKQASYGSLEPRVHHHPGCVAYASGAYADMRKSVGV